MSLIRLLMRVALVAGVIAIIGAGYDLYQRPRKVADLLHLTTLPLSVDVVACDSPWVLTDVLLTCAVTLDAAQFPLLLKGYSYKTTLYSASSREVAVAVPGIGPEFRVARIYTATPSSFTNGGAVTIYVNAAQTVALLDLYIE